MAIMLAIVAGWVGSGLFFYHLARTSWNREYGDNSAPLNYPIAALFGPIMLGCYLAELELRRGK
jgi:hypothetical protein